MADPNTPLLSPADIRAAALGVTIPAGNAADDALDRLLEKAQDRVHAAFPTIFDRVNANTIPLVRVTGVIEDMVLRVLRNPSGLRQVTIDDFTRMIDSALSTGELYLTEREQTLLAPSGRRRIGSVRVGVPAWRLP